MIKELFKLFRLYLEKNPLNSLSVVLGVAAVTTLLINWEKLSERKRDFVMMACLVCFMLKVPVGQQAAKPYSNPRPTL